MANFVAVNWSPGQLIDEESMDQLNSNQQFLKDQNTDGKIQFMYATIDTGIKLLAGQNFLPPNGAKVNGGPVGFINHFTPGTEVIVATSIISEAGTRYLSTVNGLGRWHPDYRGFNCRLTIRADAEANSTFNAGLIFNWIAVGY